MSFAIDPYLWQELCAFLAANENGRVVLEQYRGVVRKVELWNKEGKTLHASQQRCEAVLTGQAKGAIDFSS